MTKSSRQALPSFAHEQETAVIPDPPQEVMIRWIRAMLKEEFARTGQWPLPTELYYQPPMPGLAAPAAVPSAPAHSAHQEPQHRHSRTAQRTGFNYRQSEYWAAAGLLIDEQAARPVAVELRFGCQHVLSLILAWMSFPLFNGTGSRAGEWMTLGCDRMCKELHATSRNVLSWLYELERCGLVLPGRLETSIISRLEFEALKADIPLLSDGGDGGYWQARCVQAKSTFYRLKSGVARPSLPPFNPFQGGSSPEKDVKRTWETPGKEVQTTFELESGLGRTCATSFPGLHESESDYEHDMREEQIEKDLKADMDPGQSEKYSFLKTVHEKFTGSQCGEMSDQAATRLSAQYDMPLLKATLSKVGRDWTRNGHRIENPIALFISEVPKQARRAASGKSQNPRLHHKTGPINFEKYTTGKYAHLTQSSTDYLEPK